MEQSAQSAAANVSLSAILTMPRDFESIRKTIRHICAQTVRDQMELVIVTTREKAALIETAELRSLAAWQVVTLAEMRTGAVGWAAGIRRARAPIVVMCEDHSYPEPSWAEALIDAHKKEYAAVGPIMRNANPHSLISWANFLLCFSEWFSADRSGLISSGPGHNTCYKRELLLDYDDLERWLTTERLLHLDLGAKGHRILLESRATTHHVNMSLAGSYLRHAFLGGRVFGASRSAHWSTFTALAHAAAFPLVPAIRLSRLMRDIDTAAKRREARFWPALPWILAGLLVHALGEAVGYVGGKGDAEHGYMSFEMYRRDHITVADRALLRV